MRPSLEGETVHMLHLNLIIGGNQEFVERLQYSAPQRDFGHLRDWTKQIDTSIKIVRTQARRQPVVIATDPKNHVGMCMRSLRLNMRGKFHFRLVGDAIVEREVQAGLLCPSVRIFNRRCRLCADSKCNPFSSSRWRL